MLSRFASVLGIVFFSVVACEGPMGPRGERGPQGEQGERGLSLREIFIIERRITSSLYDEDNLIWIEDSRITPTTFQALYLKVLRHNPDTGIDEELYIPLDYFLILQVAIRAEWEEQNTLAISISDGLLFIRDENRDLLSDWETEAHLDAYLVIIGSL